MPQWSKVSLVEELEQGKKVHKELIGIRARQILKGHMADNSASLYAIFASELFEA